MIEDKQPKPFGISYSKLATFRRCLQQYHWKYIDKNFTRASIGQSRGSAGHAALAEWYENHNAASALDAAWKFWEDQGLEQNEDWIVIEECLKRYFDWSVENDSFELLASEQKFEIFYKDLNVILTGYIDGIIKEDGQVWLLENKFYKAAQSSNLELDAQATMYLLAASLLGKNVSGVVYNIVRVADTKIAKKEPAIRKRLYRNPEGLARVQEEVVAQVKAMLRYEQEGVPYRSPTKDCHWDCSFYGACLSMQDDGQEPTEMLSKLCYIRKDE